jgi:HlyD family secretion protein
MATPEAKPSSGLVRRIWRLLDRRRRRQLLMLQGVSVLMGLSTLGGIAAVFPFFAVLGDPHLIQQNRLVAGLYSLGFFPDPHGFLVALGIGFVGIVLLANAVNLAGFLAIDRYAQNLAADLHVALFDEYLHRDFLFHARTNSAALYSRVIYDCRRLAVGIVHSALTLVTSAITCVCIAVSALLVNPLLSAAAAALLGGGYGITYLLARRRLERNGREQTRNVIEQTRITNESFAAIKEIGLLGRQQYFRDHFRMRCDAIARTVASTAAIAQSPRHAAESLGAAGLVGVALWMSARDGQGIWIAQLGVFALAMYRLLPAMQLGFASSSRLRADADAFEQIEHDLRQGLERVTAAPAAVTEKDRPRPQRAIELQDVWFRYAPDLPDVLRGVTLRIPVGAVVGLVGPNASGKSTLADILLGLLTPDSGSVLIDGFALGAETRSAWRANVAYVPQSPLLFDACIAANVALGVEPRNIDVERLDRAIQLAGLTALATEQADRRIGERGVRLSGGQRQKIALARALYRSADFLVLDEATGALDGGSEQDVMAVMRGLRGTCTTLVIAHRMTAVRECDVIFQLGDGQLHAVGSYAELMRESPEFRRMAGGRP